MAAKPAQKPGQHSPVRRWWEAPLCAKVKHMMQDHVPKSCTHLWGSSGRVKGFAPRGGGASRLLPPQMRLAAGQVAAIVPISLHITLHFGLAR